MNTDSVTVICPKCWRKTEIQIVSGDRANNVKFSYNHYNITFEPHALRGLLTFRPICQRCGLPENPEDSMFIVDTKLADIIIKFNQAGLTTQYSCEGHVFESPDHQYSFSVPYLMFAPSIETVNAIHGAINVIPLEERNERFAEVEYGFLPSEIGFGAKKKQKKNRRRNYSFQALQKLSPAVQNSLECYISVNDRLIDQFTNEMNLKYYPKHTVEKKFEPIQDEFIKQLESIYNHLPKKD